ncbi:ABC transporter ATP-binding protein [Gordonia crocea]|uniref:Protein-tyrosine-phosphatase n=1 Tax=Gordonia crocea TaxID=589162 RepID=A0A7I9UUW0_9ACTN|nr:ABC transporter ATP-binding protein [Gordonia crocea]GED96994.1 protein-tyrosine-phosphatase [Gordonia crocea]
MARNRMFFSLGRANSARRTDEEYDWSDGTEFDGLDLDEADAGEGDWDVERWQQRDGEPLPDAMLVPPASPLHVLAAIKRFRPYMHGLYGRLVLGIILQLVDLLANVVTIALFAYIVDNVLVTGDLHALVKPMLAWVGVTALGALSSYFGDVITGVVAERMVTRVRDDLYERTQQLAPHVRRKYPSGDLIARHSGDVESTEHLVSSAVVDASLAIISVIVYATAALLAQWELALIAFALAPVLALVSRWFGIVLKRVSRRERIANGKISAMVAEGVDNSLAIQADNQGPADRRRVRAQSLEWMRARITEIKAGELYSQAVGLVELLVMLGVLVIGAWMISTDRTTLGGLIALTGYLGQLYPQIQALGGLAVSITTATASGERVAQVLDEPIAIADDDIDTDPTSPLPVPEPLPVHTTGGVPVVFDQVDFTYPDSGTRVFDDFSLDIGAGEFVSLMGPSGTGKTTVTHLLLRFYDPDSGQVRIDGTDLSTQRLQDVRSHITLLPQRIAMYRGTIADNITFSCPEASREEIIAAAKAADAHDFIVSLPDGYDTQLRDAGANLSGGQRQRIALARAFLRDTPVLILDEPTTGLDAATTERVLEPMLRLARSRTTILITHDAELAAQASRVVEMVPTTGGVR